MKQHTKLITDLFTKAKRYEKPREIVYQWRSTSEALETLQHTNEEVGVQITLEFEHNAKRKEYRADLRKVHWKSNTDKSFTYNIFSPYQHDLYPSVRLGVMAVSRYSDKSLTEFANRVIAKLDEHCEGSPVVLNLVQIAHDLK